ncbi:hypothetical protein BCR36DRAFT_287766 [Piromyces finnis]|uniref:Uncharacterized protein n=1 Tax=Piromyces finnis TaxID=1754191 RepID=A0A1Y1VCA2_9FUNG|nr:hypothetical protein BCR36DRAFT_287766 [Piromyces finnis]|eukprot:ORX51779.1 hypothetical protein BCR36DRAFT_287766 [Piromyces finnis]
MIESNKKLYNPFIGWYQGTYTVDLTDNPEIDCNFIEKFGRIKGYDRGLQYLGIRLAEYNDRNISKEGLAALDNLLNEYQERKDTIDPTTQLILRFYYDGSNYCMADDNYQIIFEDSSNTTKNKRNPKYR